MAGKKRYGSRANHYRAVKFCKRTRENSFKSAILKTSGFFKTELREEKKPRDGYVHGHSLQLFPGMSLSHTSLPLFGNAVMKSQKKLG